MHVDISATLIEDIKRLFGSVLLSFTVCEIAAITEKEQTWNSEETTCACANVE